MRKIDAIVILGIVLIGINAKRKLDVIRIGVQTMIFLPQEKTPDELVEGYEGITCVVGRTVKIKSESKG